MKGYKYRDIESFDRDFKSLLNNQIFAPQFINLNDPFEAICNEEITQLAHMLENMFKVDSSEVTKTLEKIKDFKNSLGIYSLSSTFSEELMWAHYANSHKGFCIEYEIPKLKDKYCAPKMVNEIEVDYQECPQTLTYEDIKDQTKTLKKLFATKSLKWIYEKEVRLVFDSFDVKEYHPSALTGIYFGTMFPKDKKQLMINSLTNRDVSFYEMYRENDSYNLKRKLIHRNERIIKNKIDSETYEILSTNHNPKVENFNVLYKGDKTDRETLICFFDSFRENFATKDCNVNLFDDKSIKLLIDKYPLSQSEYIELADHFIALSTFEVPKDFFWYPYQDIRYKEYGGKNWKKEKII